MTITADVHRIFADARQVHSEALERLEQGDIRDAAEKAWCATLRATNALILAHTGEEPEKTPETSRGLDRLAHNDNRLSTLVGRYYTRQGQLHGQCFYLGLCEPLEVTERRIRETIQYIQDAETLAGS
jgi:uncharacterized protein (UPF0332 family)